MQKQITVLMYLWSYHLHITTVKSAFADLDLDEENQLFDPNDRDAVEHIDDPIDILAYEYDNNEKTILLYKERQRMTRNTNGNIEGIDFHMMMQSEKPEHVYDGRKLIIHIVFDDTQGSRFLSYSSGIANTIIKHTHLGKTTDGSLRASIHFCCQSYKSQANGLLELWGYMLIW